MSKKNTSIISCYRHSVSCCWIWRIFSES